MSFDFTFRTVETREDLSRLLEFIRSQNLNYPRYQDWVSRTESEIEGAYKTGVLAISNGFVVGDLIWQPHKELPKVREIKNLRIHPLVGRRYFASFLLRQAENEPGAFHELMVDFREDHPEMSLLERMFILTGYDRICTVNLYDPNVRDIVMIKKVRDSKSL